MGVKKMLFVGAIALGMITAGCSDDKNEGPDGKSEGGVLSIKLTGDAVSSRATTDPLPFESTVNKFMVYVFNENTETLEKSVPGVVGATTTISGLSTGFRKRVVVVANAPSTFPIIDEGEPYVVFSSNAARFNLDYQSVTSAATNGLVMVGEVGNITLSTSNTTEVNIPLKRIVAKVALRNITLLPSADYEEDLFKVTGVSMQRVNSKSDIFGNALNDVSTFYCGELGSYNSQVKDYLQDDLASPNFVVNQAYKFNNYFYVFPNSDEDNCTLMTVAGTYDGDVIYFPVRINYSIGSTNTDGMLIERNKSYVLDLTINDLANGTTDPDVPPTEASLKVTVSVEEWDLTIYQQEIW